MIELKNKLTKQRELVNPWSVCKVFVTQHGDTRLNLSDGTYIVVCESFDQINELLVEAL